MINALTYTHSHGHVMHQYTNNVCLLSTIPLSVCYLFLRLNVTTSYLDMFVVCWHSFFVHSFMFRLFYMKLLLNLCVLLCSHRRWKKIPKIHRHKYHAFTVSLRVCVCLSIWWWIWVRLLVIRFIFILYCRVSYTHMSWHSLNVVCGNIQY